MQELATFPKGHAKVLALMPEATWLGGDVSGSSYLGEGLKRTKGAHWTPGAQGGVSAIRPPERGCSDSF